MRLFIKANQRLILAAFAGILLGVMLGHFLPPLFSLQEDEEVRTVDHIGQVNILPNTRIVCRYRFSKCEHSVEREVDPSPHVGHTQEEFILDCGEVVIDSFSSSVVELHRTVDGPCPQHIMLRADENGQLFVFQTDSETLVCAAIQPLLLYAASFTQEVSEELHEGIVFDSINQINEYLENAES